jgi:pSer/pThr/pTyr-binding forkhead associated (FHA) protein
MPYLVIANGPKQGQRLVISESLTRIGRVVGNHVVLDNASVSSAHAELILEPHGYRLRDLDSTNGTRVNGHRVTDTQLFRDDKILFGDLLTVFSGEELPVRSTSAAATASPTPAPAPGAPAVAAPAAPAPAVPAVPAAPAAPAPAVPAAPAPAAPSVVAPAPVVPAPVPAASHPVPPKGALPEPGTPARTTLTIATSVSGRHAAAPLPRDFRKHYDMRKIWIVIIVLLMAAIGVASWKFYLSLFAGK